VAGDGQTVLELMAEIASKPSHVSVLLASPSVGPWSSDWVNHCGCESSVGLCYTTAFLHLMFTGHLPCAKHCVKT
jgi:hypothetical protein